MALALLREATHRAQVGGRRSSSGRLTLPGHPAQRRAPVWVPAGVEGPCLNETAIVFGVWFPFVKKIKREMRTRGETRLHLSKCPPSGFFLMIQMIITNT